MTLWKKIKPAKSTQHKQTSTFNVTQFKSFSHLTYNFNNLLNFPTWELGIPHKKNVKLGLSLIYLVVTMEIVVFRDVMLCSLNFLLPTSDCKHYVPLKHHYNNSTNLVCVQHPFCFHIGIFHVPASSECYIFN